MEKYVTFLPSEIETINFGSKLANIFHCSCIIYLYGNVGTGKTIFCRGLLQTLGYIGNVKSPTYTIIESYILTHWNVYHFDLYRISNSKEIEFLGIRDFIGDNTLFLIEWPHRGIGIIPEPDISVKLTYLNQGRKAELKSFSNIGIDILYKLSLLV